MDNNTIHHTRSAEETAAFGKQMAIGIAEEWQANVPDRPHIYCLYGDLGSGKTTFTQGFAQGLGITSRLVSPTFLISKRYQTSYENRFLYHLDIYRMESEQQLQGIGINDILADIRSCIVIEWSEKLQSYLPQRRCDIRFSAAPDGSHTIQIETYE